MFAALKARIAGVLLGILLAVLLGIAAVTFIPSLSFPFSLPFIRREFTSAHELILREVRPVFTLSTVEYSYKTVFPYDFLPAGIEPGEVVRKRLRGEELSPPEEETAELLDLCRQIGIDLDTSAYQFVVITTRVRGGFRLAGTPWASEGAAEPAGSTRPAAPAGSAAPTTPVDSESSGAGASSGAGSAIGAGSSPATGSSAAEPTASAPHVDSVIRIDADKGRVEISLPPPVITSFVIEDETSEEYRYPDLEVDPREWKRITGYVRERIRRRVIGEGILEKSRENGRRLITRLLREAGWKEVQFSEMDISPAEEAPPVPQGSEAGGPQGNSAGH